MDTGIGEDSSPKSNDLEGWRKAVATGRLASFKLEEIAAAFQDLGARDKGVRNSIAEYLSHSILCILRRRVGSNHPNRGEDIILRAHHQIIVALLRPATPDGRGLREAFVARVEYRLKDAIAAENRERRVPDENAHAKAEDSGEEQNSAIVDEGHAVAEHELEEEESVEIVGKQPSKPVQLDVVQDPDENFDVNRILERITDPRKRLAFYLHMNDVPYHSKKKGVHSIAQALNISDKTARDWVEEVRQALKTDENVQYLKNGK
jgi:hypothetical protein